MAAAEQLISGYWGVNPSPVIDDYAAAYSYLTGPLDGALVGSAPKIWTILADQLVSPSPDGRPIYGFPAPVDAPLWIALTFAQGPIYAKQVDYTLADGYVWFETNPFTVLPGYTQFSDGAMTRALDLWYGLEPASAPFAPPLDATIYAVAAEIAGGCDSPATSTADEIVEDIWQAGDNSWRVITNRSAYRLAAADTPSVAIGDVLAPGTALGSAWVLTKLGPHTTSPSYITSPPEFHQGVTAGPITWYNTEVPLVVDTVANRTRVRFAIGGSPSDTAAVWTASQTNGIANGRTLAQALDTRRNPVGDPGPESLPSTINPMLFFCRELMAGCGYRLLLFPDKFGPNAATIGTIEAGARVAAGSYASLFVWSDTEPAGTPQTPT